MQRPLLVPTSGHVTIQLPKHSASIYPLTFSEDPYVLEALKLIFSFISGVSEQPEWDLSTGHDMCISDYHILAYTCVIKIIINKHSMNLNV